MQNGERFVMLLPPANNQRKKGLLTPFGAAAFILLSLLPAHAAPEETRTLHVCADGTAADHCAFFGGDGIQAAVDSAKNGDVIRIGKGRYVFGRYSDIPFVEYEEDSILNLTIRGAVLIENKNLSIVAEEGVHLAGSDSVPASAIVVKTSRVTISGLSIFGFRAAATDDFIYDGHGVFAINSDMELDGIDVAGVAKMAIAVRGDSDLDLRNARINDNHLGVWVEENSNVSIRNTMIERSEVAGIAAYDYTTVQVYNSHINGNLDDGVYTKGKAVARVTNSVFQENKPYAVRAEMESQITVRYSAFSGNQKKKHADPKSRVAMEESITVRNLKLGPAGMPQARSPLLGAGAPNSRPAGFDAPTIGLLSPIAP